MSVSLATQPTLDTQLAAPCQPAPSRRPSLAERRSADVTLSELSDAITESVSQPPPQQLTQLIKALGKGQIDLPNFCRAVRVSLGAGVLNAAVQKVANKKASLRPRSLWRHALVYVQAARTLTELLEHTRNRAAAIRLAELSLPPAKRSSLREGSLHESSLREGSLKRSRSPGAANAQDSFSTLRMKRLSLTDDMQRISVAEETDQEESY